MTFDIVCHCVSLKVKHQLDSFSKSFTRTSNNRYMVTIAWSYCHHDSHPNDTQHYDIWHCVSLKVKHQIKFLHKLCIHKISQELLTIIIWLLVHDHFGTITHIIMMLSFMILGIVCHCVSLKIKHQINSFSKNFSRTSNDYYLGTGTWAYWQHDSHHNDAQLYDIQHCLSVCFIEGKTSNKIPFRAWYTQSFSGTFNDHYLGTGTWSNWQHESHHNDAQLYDIRHCVSLNVKQQINSFSKSFTRTCNNHYLIANT